MTTDTTTTGSSSRSKFLAAVSASLHWIAHEELSNNKAKATTDSYGRANGDDSVSSSLVSWDNEEEDATSNSTTKLVADQVHPKLLEVSRLRRRRQRNLLLQIQQEQHHPPNPQDRCLSSVIQTTPLRRTIEEEDEYNGDEDDDTDSSSLTDRMEDDLLDVE